ncbi:MAG: hypothetical protein N2Z22_05465 [Turneriella sp.]|nr:hypothetical protein [Turneriella sp.]
MIIFRFLPETFFGPCETWSPQVRDLLSRIPTSGTPSLNLSVGSGFFFLMIFVEKMLAAAKKMLKHFCNQPITAATNKIGKNLPLLTDFTIKQTIQKIFMAISRCFELKWHIV